MRLLFVVLLLAGCVAPTVNPCSASTCAGCCSREGRCELGQALSQCGRGGAACTSCGVGLDCRDGVCAAINLNVGGGLASGGGVASSGGGSTAGGLPGTGGGVGVSRQELESGSRLRAVHLVGADGSRAPGGALGAALFWDTLKQEYCSPAPAFTPAVCSPLTAPNSVMLTDGGVISGAHADATCTSMLAWARLPTNLWIGYSRNIDAAGVLPALEPKYFLHNVDGGVYVSKGSLYTGPVFTLSFGGTCTRAGDTTSTAVYRDTGVPEQNLAPFSVVRD